MGQGSIDKSISSSNGHSEHNLIPSLDPFCREQKDGTVTRTLCKEIPVHVDSGEDP